MKQVLHIFAEDSRRFWPEILVSLAITAAFVWVYPRQWTNGHTSIGFSATGIGAVAGDGFTILAPILATTLTALVPAAWWLLIARVVHAESLVGDRQFWLTRPYEWPKLLAAKSLFLLVYICLSFFIAQCLLLVLAGFHPLYWLRGLLYNLLLVTGILIVSFFALATVVSNLARIMLTLLGILLCLIGISALASGGADVGLYTPYGDRISFPLFVCLSSAAIVLQYAARRTWLSRLLLVSIFVLLWIVGLTQHDAALIQRAYPRPPGPQDQVVQISYAPDSQFSPTASAEPKAKQVELNLPLRASGVADGYAVTPDVVMVAIDAPNGAHWTSPWQATYAENYLPGSQDSHVSVEINRAFYDQVRSLPVILHFTFALTQTRAGKVTRIATPTHQFSVPDFGTCAPQTWDPRGLVGIACVSALRQPPLTYVSVLWSDRPPSGSSSGPPDPATRIQGAGWAGNLRTDPAEFGITSVWNVNLLLSNALRQTDQSGRPWEPRYLWPGRRLCLPNTTSSSARNRILPSPGFISLTTISREKYHSGIGSNRVLLSPLPGDQ